MNMVFEILFGCPHKGLSFPRTIRDGKRTTTYIVCLDCGGEFHYNWKSMKVGERIDHQKKCALRTA